MAVDWKAILRGVAPTLGTIISGVNPLAGGVLKILGDKLLGDPDAGEKKLADWFAKARPEDLIALKQIEADYTMKMAELNLRPLELENLDRASARDLFKIDTGPQKRITYLFLGGYFAVLIGFAISLFAGMKVTLPAEFALIFGVITGAVPQILSFWFGSTKGSADKTAALAMSKPANGP